MINYEWAMFFDEFAGELHPTFQSELSRQLLEKGDSTGIKQFQKYNFQIIVGMKPMNIRIDNKKAYASIEFITPTSFSFLTTISWTISNSNLNLASAHKEEVNAQTIDFNWTDDFPLEKIQGHISPYRKTKASQNGFGFNANYYYLLIPDVELELFSKEVLSDSEVNQFNDLLISFKDNWDQTKKGREIQIISNLTKVENHYSIIMDIGLKNNIRTVNALLKTIGEKFGALIENVNIK